jgi:hypothetical protein
MKRILIAACVLTCGSMVSAQSLVDVAKKEKERRKKIEAQDNHTYSERDLKSNGLRTAAPAASARQADTSAGSDSATTGATAATGATGNGGDTTGAQQQDPTTTQAYWHDKVSAIDKKIGDLQTRLQSPQMNSNTQGAADRDKLQKDLARAQGERAALADEARRKGVPPGWLR